MFPCRIAGAARGFVCQFVRLYSNLNQPWVDVLIISGGISGTLAASVLSRSGHKVCLIDRHDFYPPDFRAEHLDGPMIGQLRRLGLLDALTLGVRRGETVTLARHGRVIGSARTVPVSGRWCGLRA